MAVTWGDYLSFINNEKVRQPIYKVELLRDDETPLIEITNDIENGSGALTIGSGQGVRRTCNFNIINVGNKYSKFISNINLNSKFKLYLGYMINGEPFYISQGVFYFDDPSTSSYISDVKIAITGSDKWKRLDGTNGGKFEITYTWNAGTKYSSIIRSLLITNIVNDIKEPIIDPQIENLTLPIGITKEAGETVADLFTEIADTLSCYCYYNADGRFVIEKVVPDNQKTVLHRFSREDISYLGSSKTLQNSQVHNSCYVIADNTLSGIPIYFESVNNNLSDPNSVPNVGFKKTKQITENIKGINTVELARQRCDWELQLASGKGRLINIDSVGMYHLDTNYCVELQDEYVDCDYDRFVIDSINIPIGTDNHMTLSGYYNLMND